MLWSDQQTFKILSSYAPQRRFSGLYQCLLLHLRGIPVKLYERQLCFSCCAFFLALIVFVLLKQCLELVTNGGIVFNWGGDLPAPPAITNCHLNWSLALINKRPNKNLLFFFVSQTCAVTRQMQVRLRVDLIKGLHRRGELLSTTFSVRKCVFTHEQFSCRSPVCFEGAWKFPCNAHV